MPKITEMFAFVMEDSGPDDEGVVAQNFGNVWIPLVGADMARVESLRPLAVKIAKIYNRRIKLLKFSVREEVEIIG